MVPFWLRLHVYPEPARPAHVFWSEVQPLHASFRQLAPQWAPAASASPHPSPFSRAGLLAALTPAPNGAIGLPAARVAVARLHLRKREVARQRRLRGRARVC